MTNNSLSTKDHEVPSREVTDDEIAQIRGTLRGLRFGSVHIIVQDGVIVQIERTEKRRMRTRHDCTG